MASAWTPTVSSDLVATLSALQNRRYTVYWNNRNIKDVTEIANKHYEATRETLGREHVIDKCVETLFETISSSQRLPPAEEKEAYSAEVQVQYPVCVDWPTPPLRIYVRWVVTCNKPGFEAIQIRSIHISNRS